MSYYSDRNKIKDPVEHKIVAIATHEIGAKIIVKALNYYFSDTHTRNESVEMMHANTANALKTIAKFIKKSEFDSDEIIEYLLEVSDELAAQAIVVSMRDELKFGKPKDK